MCFAFEKNLAFWELMHLSGEIKENFEEPESEASSIGRTELTSFFAEDSH